MITLRPAAAADQPRIVAIIREADINRMDLKWQNFVLAVDDATGEVVGTGQIKMHRDGSRELASIAVTPAYQHRGLAHRIVEHLLARHGSNGTLYLMCERHMGPFYEPFGFRVVRGNELPPYFRRLKRFVGIFERLLREEKLLVMKRGS
jgi:N-acetylglutamate synthase-like GNAT family acetyltransferase